MSRVRLLVASVVLGAVVAVAAIAFLAACQVVTRLALTQCAGYQDAGLAGETVFVPSAVGGPLRVWLLVPIAMLGGLVTGWLTRQFAPEAAGPGADAAIRAYYAAAKAPFSTLVIGCELTGDFGLIAPALGVCVGCFLLSGRDSLFDSQPAHKTDAPGQDSSGCSSK